MPGPNDAALAEPNSATSQLVNLAINRATAALGYDSRRVTEDSNGPKDNSFYRDNAQYMPGWGNTFGMPQLDPHGLPSGATAQDRATNYVGHDDEHGVWKGVRDRLVEKEQAAICALPKGQDGKPTGNISFGQVYDAHVASYQEAQTKENHDHPDAHANNGFIDPGSFAIAMYGAPLLEHAGINSGPATGASIDLFNDPTDSAAGGWAKRMALNGGEMVAGTMLAANPQTSDVGAALVGTGAYGAAYNSKTALDHGAVYEVEDKAWNAELSASAGVANGVMDGSLFDSAASSVMDLF